MAIVCVGKMPQTIIIDPPLSADYIRSLIDYDPHEGTFTWKVSLSNRTPVGSTSRPNSSGYVTITINGYPIRGHRVAWILTTGEWPSGEVDHKDLDKGNNKWENLRLSTSSQNVWNSPKRANNRSGFKGVWLNKNTGRYQANIKKFYKKYSLGAYATAAEAHEAYLNASKLLHGEFGRVA